MTRLRLTFCVAVIAYASSSQAETPLDFDRDIKPILSNHCFRCHGPDEQSREAELRLDQKDAALSPREDYWIVHPGQPNDSALIERIASSDPAERMPPPESGKPLTAAEIELMRRWVAAGAPWKEHWSFSAPVRPELPSTHLPEQLPDWVRNEIDYFIAQRVASAGLSPEPRADRHTLIRRLSLDLTGLPPTGERVREFLNDTGDDAYERLVDELLAAPQYGERMAVAWLDQARYADTNGFSIDGGRHMWLWRDWVIQAYNQNMPFDQFVVEQLAGDLLPNCTIDQQVATGFNRNHMITHEGGTIPAENLVNYAADRVRTTAEVFLGLTMGCAQCHDHKYDPISQRDYYRFFAYFNSLDDQGLDGNSGVNSAPKTLATSVLGRNETEVQQLRDQLESLQRQMQLPLGDQQQWERQLRREIAAIGKDLQLVPVEILNVSDPNRVGGCEIGEDGTLLLKNGGGRSPSISARIVQPEVTGLRLVFLPDPSFPRGGLGDGDKEGFEGSFLLTSLSASATTVPSDQVDLNQLLAIRNATASSAAAKYPAVDCLDPRDSSGWSPGPIASAAKTAAPQYITLQFDRPMRAAETPYLTVMLVWGAGDGLTGGKCRLFTMSGNDDRSNISQDVQEILLVPSEQRSPPQSERLRSYHASVAPERANVRYQIENLRERLAAMTARHEVMVMNTAKKPRATHVLNRGQYDQPGDVVTPGVPMSFPQPAASFPQNRLGLAQWLVQADHPLTARVAVNRLWQMLFGKGIVATSADFGSQGDRPTHPELLDWLARDFIEHGWDVKRALKNMVMSAAYQQSSVSSPEKIQADPYNQLLSRGPRFRLTAEFVRDSVLQVSGLLVQRIGGPSVLPYQPPNLWREVSHFGSSPATAQAFVQDHGERLYRRSMYTYWKRTVPPPAMVSFDAPNREICTVERPRTNTPLQALVLLNDPQFVEASRNFAQRILHSRSETDARIQFAFQQALARHPTDDELQIVADTLKHELQRFRQHPGAAEAYLNYGEAERDPNLALDEHAAWTTVASLIFNLSEMITKG